MPFCSKCGASVEGRFCTKCGSPATETAPSAPKPELAINVASALCYLPGFVVPIIFLFWAPYSRDKSIRFHAFQSIFLQACWLAILVALGVLVSWAAPALWHGLERLANLAGILLTGFMIWKTYQSEKVVLPYIGPLAEKQA